VLSLSVGVLRSVSLARDKWCGCSGRGYIYPMGASHPGQLPKWPNGADCKSAVGRLRGFESLTAHLSKTCPCGAAVAHSLGKTGVMGSIPITGSRGC
jgi:hypothetical protein